MNIFDTKDTRRAHEQYSAVFQHATEVMLLREALSRLGVNGRHIHVLHGETGRLALSARTTQPEPMTRVVNFLLKRTSTFTDFSAEIEALRQGARIVMVDLPRDPRTREQVKAAFRAAGPTSPGGRVQGDPERSRRRAPPLTP